MAEGKMRAAIVGCGNIAGPYASTLKESAYVELVSMADIDPARATALAEKHGCVAVESLDDLLEDDSIELVVNLTIHHAHYEVTRRLLEAGKHVYSEKPLALSHSQAQELVDLARQQGVRLGCSPFTWMGEAQQTVWKHIREGDLGTVRVAYAEVNWACIETWHPAPEPFYEVGALWDVGVYPLTLLTTFFGPVRRVLAYAALLHPNRTTKHGNPFTISTPDFAVSMLELANGTVVRLTTNFYVTNHSKQQGIEFHGDRASLYLASWQDFDARIEFAPFNQPYEPIPLIRESGGLQWGYGAEEMARAILEGRPHRATGEQAAHVVEVLAAISESIRSEGPVEVHTEFPQPAPLEWAQ